MINSCPSINALLYNYRTNNIIIEDKITLFVNYFQFIEGK